jgi:hypothetical protein
LSPTKLRARFHFDRVPFNHFVAEKIAFVCDRIFLSCCPQYVDGIAAMLAPNAQSGSAPPHLPPSAIMNAIRLFLILALALGSISHSEAQPKAADTLKRAGLLPDPNAKPPTITKQEGELVEALITVWQTERGRQSPVPTPAKPIYYVAYDGGFRDNVKGITPPPAAAIGRTVRAALASAGYEPATNENLPSVAIIYRLSFEHREVNRAFSENGNSSSYTGPLPPPQSTYAVTVSAYAYDDLARSTNTLLWVTQCRSGGRSPIPPKSDPKETYLALATACTSYFGALLPADTERKTDQIWLGIPHRDDLTDPTPAFPTLAVSTPVLNERAFRDMERLEQTYDEEVSKKRVAAGGMRISRDARTRPVEISPALARRIANYLAEKNALQESLRGAATSLRLDTFAVEHASQISSLTLTGEAIRRTIIRMDDPTADESLRKKSLDALLRQFEPQIRASTNPATDAKGSEALKRAGLLPDPNPKPPTISKQEGGLLYGTIAMWQTERGRQTPVPTPRKPIYYVAYDAGLRASIDGVKIPAPATMGRTLRAALASAGYEPATDEHRPSLAIVYRMDYYGGVSGGGAPSRSPGVSGELVANDSTSSSFLSFTCQVTISAYDYEDLTRSTKTLLWVTQSGATDPKFDLEEAYLAFVEACAPYFGALLPEASPRKLEGRTWVAVPHRDNLMDQTPAFPALSLQPPVLDQGALRELERQERAFDRQISQQAAPARSNAKPPAPVEISPGVGPRIANYLREKKALEEILAMRTQGVEAGADKDRVLGTFVAEHAHRISTLMLTGEALRRTILTQATTTTIWRNPNLQDYANGWIEDRALFDDLKSKPLETVLLELKSQIRASSRPVTETKTSAKPTSSLLKTEATSETAQTADSPRTALPTALAARIDSYQQEKAALQNALSEWLKSQPRDTATSAAVKNFNESNATRIATLTRAHEKIRADLAALKAANPTASDDKSLDDLLHEFAGGTREYWAR